MDDQAVSAIHTELAPMLIRLARAMLQDQALAEDAVQDAFLLFATRVAEIPTQQRQGWLVRTVQLSALSIRRSRSRQQQLGERWLVRQPQDGYETGSTAEQQLEQIEQLDRVREALLQLPANQQLIVKMRLVEDQTFQQIADQLQLPLGTVLSRMRLAMEKLRSRLT